MREEVNKGSYDRVGFAELATISTGLINVPAIRCSSGISAIRTRIPTLAGCPPTITRTAVVCNSRLGVEECSVVRPWRYKLWFRRGLTFSMGTQAKSRLRNACPLQAQSLNAAALMPILDRSEEHQQ